MYARRSLNHVRLRDSTDGSPLRLSCPRDILGKNTRVAAFPPPRDLPDPETKPKSPASCIGGGLLLLSYQGSLSWQVGTFLIATLIFVKKKRSLALPSPRSA